MSFSQIKGHKSQIDSLVKSLQSQRVAQSYLFVGQDGIGKSLIAENFAKLLNCEGSNAFDCCDNCSSCLKTQRRMHPDILRIQAEGDSIKIDQMRELKRFFSFASYEAKYKVAIIDGAQFLTIEASNSLLKVLEEPNKTAIIILITPTTDKLLATVVSRCQTIRFKSLSSEMLFSILLDEYNFDQKQLPIYVNYSNGSLGTALRLKGDNFLSFREQIITNLLSNRKDRLAKELFDAPSDNDFKKIVFILLTLVRDSFILRSSFTQGCLINIDHRTDIEGFLKHKTSNEIFLIMGEIIKIYDLVDKSINKRLIVESLLSYVTVSQNEYSYH